MENYDELYNENYRHRHCDGKQGIRRGTERCESCVKIAQVREKCRASRSRVTHMIHEENTGPMIDITRKSFKEYIRLCVRRIKKFAATGFARINAFRKDDISNIVFVMVDRTNSRSRCSFIRIDSNGNTQKIPRDSILGTNLLNSLPNILTSSPDQHSCRQKINHNPIHYPNSHKKQHVPQRLRFNVASPISSIQSTESTRVNVSRKCTISYNDNHDVSKFNNSSDEISDTATSQIFSTKAQLSQLSFLSNNQTDLNTATPCPIKNVSSSSVLKSNFMSNINSATSTQESCNFDKEMRYMRLQHAISHELRDLVAASHGLENRDDSAFNSTKTINTYPPISCKTSMINSKRYGKIFSSPEKNFLNQSEFFLTPHNLKTKSRTTFPVESIDFQIPTLDSAKSSITTFDKESDTSPPLRTSTESTVVSSTTASIKCQIFSKIAKGRNALIPPKLPTSNNINKRTSLTSNTKLNKGNLGTVSKLVELFEGLTWNEEKKRSRPA
ncbi:hypothetical protein T552_00028 [Pneumocystis carinii B80]|uniref:Uncharacterized protein n=1 Tax=Pneumocystis carinii (strain B80) TaxID=1408658 RepID=A0A0W4ZSN0_PNEC8|nr:hypothetical protein T552_00028 [Pneumocystis carinii B80]KTW31383.1 hypothetical protein T552_00028 [Pneumocystis carinii B80]